jgi:hypothetical protein
MRAGALPASSLTRGIIVAILKILGRRLSPDELQNLSRAILTAWDRLFTDLEPDGSTTYVFVRTLAELDHAMIVIVRAAVSERRSLLKASYDGSRDNRSWSR